MKKLYLVPVFILLTAIACGPISLVPGNSSGDPSSPLAGAGLPSATPFIASSYPTSEAPDMPPDVVVSGIDISMTRAWQEGKQVYTEVCYSLPDLSNWTVWKASLNYPGAAIQEFGATQASLLEPGADGQPGKRCDILEFYVPPDANLSLVVLRVDALAAYPYEEGDCTIYGPKIQQTLNGRGIAITLDCQDVNGSSRLHIASLPEGMSQEEAEKIVFSDEFFSIPGPWDFPFSIGQ